MIQPIPWRGLSFIEKLLLFLLPLVAFGFLLMPILDQAFLLPLSRLPGMRSFVDWLVNSGGSWIMGVLMLAAWIGLIILERRRLNNNRQLWVDSGCPKCTERELVRVGRQRTDRLYGLIGVRAFRYACRNCTWRGLRIGRRHHLFDEEALADEFGLVDSASAAPEQSALELGLPVAVAVSPAPARVVEVAPLIAPAAEVLVATQVSDSVAPEAGVESPVTAVAADPYAVKVAEIAQLKQDTGFSDEELEWLWRRVSEEK